jgi:hypothetical protein
VGVGGGRQKKETAIERVSEYFLLGKHMRT